MAMGDGALELRGYGQGFGVEALTDLKVFLENYDLVHRRRAVAVLK